MTSKPLFLMTDPRHYGVFYEINPWMEPQTWAHDPAGLRTASASASRALRLAIEMAGGVVELLPPVEGVPDLVFPANAAVVLDGKVLLARFRDSERQREEPVFRSVFQALKARGAVNEVIDLPPDVLQEGAGDCIWDADRGFFWAGFGQRSTRNSLQAIETVFNEKVVGLELATSRFYHLDTCFCPLSGNKVLYHPPAFTPAALAQIHTHIAPADRIEASVAEARAFSVNAVNIGRQIVMAKAPPSLRRKLLGLGYQLHEVDLAPFILSGGGAYCMTLRLDRKSRAEAAMRAAE
ncbi:MAG TPA: arginine deiminase-related protein [Rhizomicrobium sp.]|nr:arginine deiminase-related protein [Rhizomicrobium sp.]